MERFIKFCLILTAVSFCFSSSVTYANLSVAPYNADRANPLNKDWFTFSAKAGETIEDALIFNNSGQEEYEVRVLGKDVQITAGGGFTLIPDQQENQEVGKWIGLNTDKLQVPIDQSIKLPFKIEIPQDSQDGEYAAGFGVTQIKPKQESLNIEIRKGVRAYIAVGDGFKLGSKIENLNILDPKDPDYSKTKNEKQYFGKDNTVMTFEAQNTGNIFGILNCKYALNYSNGDVFEGFFSTELAPRVGKRNYAIITNQSYQTGQTEAILDCTTEAQNIDSKKVVFENQKAVISDKLDFNQSELDSFEMSMQPAFEQVMPNQAGSIDSMSDDGKKDNETGDQAHNWWIYVAGFGFMIGLVIIIILVLKRKNIIFTKNKQ
jgi:hypothetical protein